MTKLPQKREHNLSGTLKRRLIDIQQSSEYVGIPVNTIYKMVSQRKIPFVKIGGSLRFDIALLDEWIKQQTVMPMPNKSY